MKRLKADDLEALKTLADMMSDTLIRPGIDALDQNEYDSQLGECLSLLHSIIWRQSRLSPPLPSPLPPQTATECQAVPPAL